MKVGHIHGRFQPFHDEHAKYAHWAGENCDRLIIGITNADPSHVEREEVENKRHKPKHNPFFYFERHRMIDRYIETHRMPCETSIMPFPVNRPDLWEHYAPPDAIHHINVLEEWHEVKADRIHSRGREVVTKRDRRNISGREIREKMSEGGEWESDVPDAVVEVIHEIGGVERVSALYEG